MKYWVYLLVGMFLVSIAFVTQEETVKEKEDEEVRAVYFSYIEFSKYITDKTDNEMKDNIRKVLDNLKENNFNRIIVHVRPFSDSIYESNVYPVSKYVLNSESNYPSFDVLKYFIDEAHKRGIKLDAWINPYRISNLKDEASLPSNSIYFKYKDTEVVKVTESGIYFNPASITAQDLIVKGIKEIVDNYDVDGIHFDDYFYPDKEIDLINYQEYSKKNNITIEEYRLNNVKELLKKVYKTIKETNKKVLFGIAPQGNIDNCYNESYLDIKEILKSNEYIDYIMPQIYFGFNNETRPFIKTINEWNNLIENKNIKLIPALAFYKIGSIDKYALSGSNEWINNTDIIKREIEVSRTIDNYKGFSLFSYNYLFNPEYQNNNTKIEFENLKSILSK